MSIINNPYNSPERKLKRNIMSLQAEIGLARKEELPDFERAKNDELIKNGNDIAGDEYFLIDSESGTRKCYRFLPGFKTADEFDEAVQTLGYNEIRQISANIKTIKGCVIFFVVLACIGIAVWLLTVILTAYNLSR